MNGISFDPLWETMEKQNISQYKLMQMGIDTRLLDALRHNKNITLLSLKRVCDALDCTPDQVVKFVENDNDIT